MPEPQNIEAVLKTDARLRAVAAQPEAHRLQIVLGLIEEGEGGKPRLVQHGYRLDAEYFYPASAVKLFAAVAALEELARLRGEAGLPLDRDTSLAYHPLFEDEEVEAADPTNLEGGIITVGHEIRKLFLVSDNQAFNRLYELVGQDRLNASAHRAGLDSVCILHRLSEARGEEENRRAPAIDFLAGFLSGEETLFRLPERLSEPQPAPPDLPGWDVGEAYLQDGERIEAPMDFRGKNRVSLADLQRALAKVVRPDLDSGDGEFELSPEDRSFLLAAMSQFPGDSPNPVYDRADYPDGTVKFFLAGLENVVPRENLEIYNKIGQAYGFSTENAYIVDTARGQAFFLAATLYTNDDGTLNDDNYEYTTVAEPFFAALGEKMARAVWR